MINPFKIIYRDKKTSARVGILNTKKGKIETPFFMPVATKAAVKHINSKKLEEIGTEAVISNSLMIHLRPGEKTVKKMGGIGKFMNFSGINATDSGGFQMYSNSIYIDSNDNGVYFKNPLSGEKLFITPEKDMQIQLDIDSDIAMCLDSMPLYNNSKKGIEESVRKTILWAKRCKTYHDKMQKKIPLGKKQLLFSISQGGVYPDLREKCSKELLKLDFDGYAIGGIALPESCYNGDMENVKKQEHDAIRAHKKVVTEDKIIYVMGEGDPIWLLEAVNLGCDMFDSRYPTQAARRGTVLTTHGKMKILNKKYEYDKKPIDPSCKCFVCKNYSRAYIRSLLKEEESVGRELASYHNLYYMQRLIEEIREAIKKGKFLEFKNKIKKAYQKK
jgi:queuine tRNA-ribosyltransferase